MEMALVLVPVFCLLSGAYAQDWGVTLTPGPLAGWVGSCVTIPCSFTYPAGWNVSAVNWTRDGDQTVYHSNETHVHADFQGRARYLGDQQHNCSLRVTGLRPSDNGTYRFRFEAVRNGSSEGRTSDPGQQLNVSAHPCQPSLGHRMEPGPSLTCTVGAACPHHPSWYNRDGARRSPEQTPGQAGATKLRISPSQLDPGAALRCQVDGYRDECDSDQPQPLGTATLKLSRVEVSWLAGQAALSEGDNFTLCCRAAALWPVAGYVWSRGDVWLTEARKDLRVDKAAVSDGGSYACGVWVFGPGWGYLSLSARELVEVQHAPTGVRVMAAPGTSPQEGESVTLTCNYTSSLPAPKSYAWYRGSQRLEGSRQEMVLKSIAAEQAGEYRCEATNEIGWSQSPRINITVWCCRNCQSLKPVLSGCSNCQSLNPVLVACVVVAVLLLIILVNVGVCYLLVRGRRQAGAKGSAEGAEFSLRPETESPYEELEGPTQDIYSQLDSPPTGSH